LPANITGAHNNFYFNRKVRKTKQTNLMAEHNQKRSPVKQDSILKPEKYLLNESKSIPED